MAERPNNQKSNRGYLSADAILDGRVVCAVCRTQGNSQLPTLNSRTWWCDRVIACVVVVVVVCCLLFLTFSVLVANPKKLLYTVANPARGLLNREKRTKEKVWQHTPPPPTPHTARSEKINKITRRIYRRYAGGRSRVRTRIPSARRLGLWVWLRKILHSCLL